MKALFVLSLVLNMVLGYFLVTRKPEKKIIERTIIETHEKKVPAAPSSIDTRKVIQPEIPKKEKSDKAPEGVMMMDSAEFQDMSEKIENDRRDFLIGELGMTEDKIKEHIRLRDEFFKQSSLMWQKHPTGDISFKARRQLIDMEENLHKQLEKLHGKKNWERYQKFRENYNKRSMKRQEDDMMPTVFMGL